MEIEAYNEGKYLDKLTSLLCEKYRSLSNFEYFLDDYLVAYKYATNSKNIIFRPIAGFVNDKLVAHVALVVDRRLDAGTSFFGFFECTDNVNDFNLLWEALLKEAKSIGISNLKGPVNGSVWHQYRCIKESDGYNFFKSENICELYYYDLLMSNKPRGEIAYYSASRSPFLNVLEFIDESEYLKIESHGFNIKRLVSTTLEDMLAIVDISKSVFSSNWGYTDLDTTDFLGIYSEGKMANHLSSLYVLYKGDKAIGFCSTSKEDGKTLICKTICILPEYQGLGLGNALAYKIHLDAKHDGFENMIYALIREGNDINKFPRDDTKTIRKYSAFEFDI